MKGLRLSTNDILMSRQPITRQAAGVYTAGAQGNSLVIDLGDMLSARQLDQSARTQLALHVVDLLAPAAGDAPVLCDAREFKARLCRQRARQVSSIVSRQILLSSAEDLPGLPVGIAREQDPQSNFT